jgi:hypothetical protein
MGIVVCVTEPSTLWCSDIQGSSLKAPDPPREANSVHREHGVTIGL